MISLGDSPKPEFSGLTSTFTSALLSIVKWPVTNLDLSRLRNEVCADKGYVVSSLFNKLKSILKDVFVKNIGKIR